MSLLAPTLVALASVSQAQNAVEYGVREVGGETWAYIETADGQELIAAPFAVLSNGSEGLGAALAGTGGVEPALVALGTFGPASSNTLELSGALPGASAVLVIGFTEANQELLGGFLVPSPDVTLNVTVDASGSATVPIDLPSNWVSGTDLFAQFWITDAGGPQGASSSNAVRCNDELFGATVEDPARMRVLGFDLAGLEAREDKDNTAYVALLNGTEVEEAAALWDKGFPNFNGTPGEVTVLSHLSQHMTFFEESSTPYAGGGWVANGCTAVPDFDFKACCDAHDRCYCMGGNAADRKKCDDDLRKCIRAKGHWFLSWVYYWGVRAFGSSHFCWMDEAPDADF